MDFYYKMAETEGFEPSVAFTTQPFQDCTLSRSDKSPIALIYYRITRKCQV